MNDRIRIEGLRVATVVGVHAWEREAPRELLLDLVLETDLGPAADSDDLADTVDYDALARDVTDRVAALGANLIETVADEAAWACLAHPRVDAVKVTVHKPGAVATARSVSVTVRRRRA